MAPINTLVLYLPPKTRVGGWFKIRRLLRGTVCHETPVPLHAPCTCYLRMRER